MEVVRARCRLRRARVKVVGMRRIALVAVLALALGGCCTRYPGFVKRPDGNTELTWVNPNPGTAAFMRAEAVARAK